ncbi:hypothetical protein M3667_03305 [Microbacterium sp. P26]|uniref:hypothetical protein n=1 Tax=Microbacterium TaxID=33882 RepID=UPI00203C70E6|nr:hypothetical protein [Microbacterium sp. P26]MCM3500905.1 hypothetical protein [Microbacterium sp. P26]
MSNRSITVSSAIAEKHVDLLVVALGFEERGRFVAENGPDSDTRLAFAFPTVSTLSYEENRLALERLSYEILPLSDDFGAALVDAIEGLDSSRPRIGIDISSLTRVHLAEIIDALVYSCSKEVSVDFLYAPARSDAWEVDDGPIRVAEPVHPSFSAWADDAGLPLSAIIGVGVEESMALGAAEFLDVSNAYAFVPTNGDVGFDAMNEKANHDFFLAEYMSKKISYSIQEPFDLFTRLEGLVYGLSPRVRIALVPLGPKIFALCSLLVSLIAENRATVWRFSASANSTPVQRRPSGRIVSLRVKIA